MTTPEEHVKAKLAEYPELMPYDDFTDLATSVAHIYSISLEESTKLIHSLRGKTEIGSQEFQNKGFGKNKLWQGQEQAHGFGMRPPGDLAEPKSSLVPLSKLELFSYKQGDIVRVVNNDQAPWGGEYKGVIEAINAQNTFDIRDIATGVLHANQPARLLRNPLGEGRPDVRVQQRRVGDPKGMGESAGDIGGSEVHQDYPNANWMPSGHPGQDVKNPQSMFYKEAHCGPCTPLKMKAIELLSDMHYKFNNFDRKYLGQLAAQSDEESNEGFTKTLKTVIMAIKPDKDTEAILLKLQQIASTLVSIQSKITDGEFKVIDKPADKLYSFLLSKIVKEYGETPAAEVVQYLEGKISTPSRRLYSVLMKYNIAGISREGIVR